jgi:MFS family permease
MTTGPFRIAPILQARPRRDEPRSPAKSGDGRLRPGRGHGLIVSEHTARPVPPARATETDAMHFDAHTETTAAPPLSAPDDVPWYRQLNGYQWFVFIVASLGWLFDTMDQQLFNLAREPAVAELLHTKVGDPKTAGLVAEYRGYATTIFILGWATGGLIFGIMGDRVGRAKTMILTILLYSMFTGLSALSVSVWDFAFYRFLTGLGVGGEFAVGVSLVAEVMPDRARPFALGMLQALSAVGNILAACLSWGLGRMEETGALGSAWRATFLIGVLPALLSLFVLRRLREPESWVKAREADLAAEAQGLEAKRSSFRKLFREVEALFGDPRWRHNAIVGMLLGFSAVVGLWGIGFFSPELTGPVFRKHFSDLGFTGQALEGKVTSWKAISFGIQNVGAFFGIYAFSRVTHIIGRRPTFAISYLLAMGATAMTFWFLDDFTDVYWMIPLMGFCQISLFGGLAIYLPELFPTRLRSTGTSFCYNVGRFFAAVGPSVLGLLTSRVFAGTGPLAFRYAAITMCSVFLIGLLALPFAPETRGQPLPE